MKLYDIILDYIISSYLSSVDSVSIYIYNIYIYMNIFFCIFSVFIFPHRYSTQFFPQTVCLTLGVLTVVVKGRVARSRWRTECVAIFVVSCLHVRFVCEISWFWGWRGGGAAVLCVNFRSFRLLQLLRCSYFVVILVLFGDLKRVSRGNSCTFFGSSTSSMFIFRGNSRTFRWSRMVLNGVFIIKLVLF